jgi:transporter family-2 protein
VTVAEPRVARRAPALLATPARALVLAVASGAAISLQAYVNGQLGARIDSAMVAAFINNLVAVAATLAVALAGGALVRGIAQLRAAERRPPLWHWLGGLVGAALVGVTTVGAPEVGVALLTVAIVCGSTLGALPVDAAGLGPAGRRAITAPRVAGVVLAVAATAIGALGSHGEFEPVLLGLALLVGCGIALQAAANGQLARESGEPFLASTANTTVGLAALTVVAAVSVAVSAPGALPANPLLYLGGLCGAFVVVVGAAAVQTLGVLRLGLAVVAGQTLGALAIDLIAPAEGERVTVATVAGVVLTLIAVWVSGRAGLRRLDAPAAS